MIRAIPPNLNEEIEIISRVLNKDDFISIEQCQHGEPVNPYHLEGSVLNHTALVLKECYKLDVPKDVILAILRLEKLFTKVTEKPLGFMDMIIYQL